MLKRILIGALSVLLLALCGWMLRELHLGAAHAFRDLYADFDVTSPEITHLLLNNLAWWPLMLMVLSIVSLMPVLCFRRRLWLSVLIPVSALIAVVGLIYAPMFSMAHAVS